MQLDTPNWAMSLWRETLALFSYVRLLSGGLSDDAMPTVVKSPDRPVVDFAGAYMFFAVSSLCRLAG